MSPCCKANVDVALQVGESGLGKSTFIENLQSAFQPGSPSSARSSSGLAETLNTYEVFEQSPELLCTEITINNGTSRFHYFLQVSLSQLSPDSTLPALCTGTCT